MVQVIIPMSGFGERFRKAGYNVPKPLIPVDGKPIVAHVIDLFPGETDFLFICNQDHLDEPAYGMADILKRYCPTGRIIGIDAHKLGPIGAVRTARKYVRADEPVFVNYCDFTCYWDWADFKAYAAETQCSGAVPAYRGFHPHSLGSTYYAYLRHQNLWLTDIQEKKPYTDQPMDEYASSGGYYFKTGALCLSAFDEVVERDLHVNNEYYVSMAYKVLAQRGEPVGVYDLQHFMQWGTPQDLEEYLGWSAAFRQLALDDARRARQGGSVLVPMAGLGKRFADAGWTIPKPMIPVSGRPMVIQATRDLPDAPATRFVLRQDLPGLEEIRQKLRTSFVGASDLVLDRGTDGQATTCMLGLQALDQNAPLTIGACDNAMLYDTSAFEEAVSKGDADLLVWVVRGHADGRLRPQMFGWVTTDDAGAVTGVRVKEAPDDPATAPMIVGAFTFRRASQFGEAYRHLQARDARVNGELYVDTMVEDALALGFKVELFEIDHYLGWGTPKDLTIFEYWQSCFHKWAGSPYRLGKDRRIPLSAVAALAERFKATRPQRPSGPPPGPQPA
jgi:NDP-sugar pyrophosphorylase family protein